MDIKKLLKPSRWKMMVTVILLVCVIIINIFWEGCPRTEDVVCTIPDSVIKYFVNLGASLMWPLRKLTILLWGWSMPMDFVLNFIGLLLEAIWIYVLSCMLSFIRSKKHL